MSLLQILPVLALLGCVSTILAIAAGRRVTDQVRWILPAALGAIFAGFSGITVAQEGLIQFWLNHTSDLSGNQVWFDLLFAVTIGFYLIAPRARAVGMPLMPWAIAVTLTACIALLPMLARVVWLEQRAAS